MKTSKIFLPILVCVCAYTLNAQIITIPPVTPTTITKISQVSVGTTGDVTIGSRTTTRICTGESYENINFSGIKIYTTVDVGNRVAVINRGIPAGVHLNKSDHLPYFVTVKYK